MGNLLVPSEHPALDNFTASAFKAAGEGDVEQLRHLAAEPGLHKLADLADPVTGESLLHVAMTLKNGACARFLMSEAGCRVHCRNSSGETPVHAACMNDSVEGLRAALELKATGEAGPLLGVKDMWRRTPLIKAMVYGSEHVVRELLELDGDVIHINAQDEDGFSAAHLAARYGQLDILRKIAEKSANLNLQYRHEKTPLSLAITAINPDMVRLLLELGAQTAPCTTGNGAHPVVLAIGQLISSTNRRRHGLGASCTSERAEQVLHLMLEAHGFLLHPYEPDVFLRVLYSADMKRYLPLLYKMHLCSDSLCSNSLTNFPVADQSAVSELQGRLWNNAPRSPLSLFDLARRRARQALMASGRNVMWAVDRLRQQSCGVVLPPALLGLLLMKDCDRKEFSDRTPPVPWPTSAGDRMET